MFAFDPVRIYALRMGSKDDTSVGFVQYWHMYVFVGWRAAPFANCFRLWVLFVLFRCLLCWRESLVLAGGTRVNSYPNNWKFPGLSVSLPQNCALGIPVLIPHPSIPKLASSKTRVQKLHTARIPSITAKRGRFRKIGFFSNKIRWIGSRTKSLKSNWEFEAPRWR